MEHEASFLSAFLGLAFVLGIIFSITYLFKRFAPSLMTATAGNGKKNGIVLLDVKAVDPRNRLVLVRCKEKEYLLLTGESNAVVGSFDAAADDIKEDGHAES